MSDYVIRHQPRTDPPRFEIVSSGEAESRLVPPADTFPVEGRPASHLTAELRWYLESFLDYPFPPETERAERVRLALRRWGEVAFESLFGSATLSESGEVRLSLESDDPRVLSWPWEALHDPKAGAVGQWAHLERRLSHLDARPMAPELPRDRLRVLLVTARLEDDATYRSVSRPLLDLVTEEKLPVVVHILRPPSLKQLQTHLRQHPHAYHVLHFDGHGTYEQGTGKDAEGHLYFESDDGGAFPVPGSVLGKVLSKRPVPIVVLNACQSAMLDPAADNAFASVATSLLRAGVRSVVAMAWSLYISGAEVFLPAFYRAFCETGSVAIALGAGRRRMCDVPGRLSARGRFPLGDWIVPVLYQGDSTDLFLGAPQPCSVTKFEPPYSAPARPPLGFVGRDSAFMDLERAWRRPEAAIVVQGLGGVGKTALARAFAEWRYATEALRGGCIWIDFRDDTMTPGDVFRRLGEFASDDACLSVERPQQVACLAQALREKEILIVWDGFERVTGLPGTSIQPAFAAEDRADLRQLVHSLRGGRAKVLMLSRGREGWLDPERTTLSISGLRGEARWDYCERVFAEHGVEIDRADSTVVDGLGRWAGHPLALAVMLPRLGDRRSAVSEPLMSPLREVCDALPWTWRPLLWPLSFHERYVDRDFLVYMARRLDPPLPESEVEALFRALTAGGLLRGLSPASYEMHPVLGDFLHARLSEELSQEVREAGSRAFVAVISALAQGLSLMPIHDQRRGYPAYGGTFRRALSEAGRFANLVEARSALLQALAHHAQNEGELDEALDLFTQLLELCQQRGDAEGEAVVCHQLGMVTEEQGASESATEWYEESLAIKRRLGLTSSLAVTFHQLGRLAEEKGELEGAHARYLEAVKILEPLGDDRNVARSYHQLGNVCEKQGELEAATKWYRKSLDVHRSLGLENEVATTLHQLGMVAVGRKEFDSARRYYERALVKYRRLDNEREAAHTCHQLGNLAEAQRGFDEAAEWYRKALNIEEQHGFSESQARSYYQLGEVTRQQHDFESAEQWYRKSLARWQQLGRVRKTLASRLKLGRIARARGDFESAFSWTHDFLDLARELGDEAEVAVAYHDLGRAAQAAGDLESAARWYRKRLESEENLGQEEGAAQALHQLGRIEEEQGDLDAAERRYRRSLEISERTGRNSDAAATLYQLGVVAERQDDYKEAVAWLVKAQALYVKLDDPAGLASVCTMLGLMAAATGHVEHAGQMFLQSVRLYRKAGDPGGARDNVTNFRRVLKGASESERDALRSMWEGMWLGSWAVEVEGVGES